MKHIFLRVLFPLALLVLPGCRGLSRDINNALPAFLRADPGKEEMEIFSKVRQSREWSEEDVERQKTLFDAAVATLEAGRPGDAAELLDDYLDQYPTSVYDEVARYRLGEAYYLDDDYDGAHTAFREFAAVYPVSALVPKVVEIEYAMGREFIHGNRSTFFGIFSQRTTGESILTQLVELFPRSARAADAQWELGRYYMDHEEDWSKARSAFRFLTDQYVSSEWYKPALFDEGYSIYRQVKGAVYDPRMMSDTKLAMERYLREAQDGNLRAEADAIIVEMTDLQARHLLEVGTWYIAQGKEYSSRFYLTKVRDTYPGSSAAAEAERLLAEIGPGGAAAPIPPAEETPPADPARPGGS